MSAWRKVLRSAYFTPEIDKALETRAEAEAVSKGALIVEYVEQGLGLSQSTDPDFEAERPIQASSTALVPKVLRSFYLPVDLDLAVSSRVSAERAGWGRLIVRFCVEGLAGPPSGGMVAVKAQRRLIAAHKAKIEHLRRLALDARHDLDAAIAEFRKTCPHLPRDEHPPTETCQDCGLTITRLK